MQRYLPIILEQLDIRIPRLRVRRLALHRHLPETTAVAPHAHNFSQCLLYLSGRGTELIGDSSYRIETGTALFLPPHIQHAFRREANRRPICLVVDFDWREASSTPQRVASLPAATLHEVRRQLVRLIPRRAESAPQSALHTSVIVLGLLETLLSGFVLPRQGAGRGLSPVTRRLETLFAGLEAARLPLATLAQQAGYQHDYLNRLLKQHTGLTLGQMRARTLVARAQQLLLGHGSIGEVARTVGYDDPNYFARWFRKNTGLSPGRWRTSHQRTNHDLSGSHSWAGTVGSWGRH